MATPPPAPAALRLFVAAAVPPRAQTVIREALAPFAPAMRRLVPAERWHITFVFIGETHASAHAAHALAGTISQLYAPTVRLTHVGVGQAPGQLWAYAQPTELLHQLRSTVVSRLHAAEVPLPATNERPFVPHIRLAELTHKHPLLLPAVPILMSFAISELFLYASVPTEDGHEHEPRERLLFSS